MYIVVYKKIVLHFLSLPRDTSLQPTIKAKTNKKKHKKLFCTIVVNITIVI